MASGEFVRVEPRLRGYVVDAGSFRAAAFASAEEASDYATRLRAALAAEVERAVAEERARGALDELRGVYATLGGDSHEAGKWDAPTLRREIVNVVEIETERVRKYAMQAAAEKAAAIRARTEKGGGGR